MRCVKAALLILCLVTTHGPVTAASAAAAPGIEELFEEGNEAYSRGDYQAAIAGYHQLTAQQGYAPGVLFNLANSHAQAGQPGKAILNYLRALRLSPSNPDIGGNLELVKKENGLFPRQATGTEKFFRLLNLNQWALLILCPLVLLVLILVSAMQLRFSRQLTISLGAGCLLFTLLASAGTYFQYQYFNPSVVTGPDARLYISPFASAASSGAIQEGRLVYPQKTHNGFTYVTDETDRKGWIPSAAIEAVCNTGGTQ